MRSCAARARAAEKGWAGDDALPRIVSGSERQTALSPFRVRSFRFQWPADLCTSWAFEMETLILGWYVLVESGSVLMLTIFGALQYLGTLIAPMMGVVGDRIGQRNLLCVMRAIYATLSAGLMTLAFAGQLSPELVLVFAAVLGIVRPSDMGIRSAVVAEIMPTTHLVSAMGIARTTSDSARIVGALTGAGMFAALGMAPAYMLVTCFYTAGFLFTLGVARAPSGAGDSVVALAPRTSPWRDLREGLAYIWNKPHLQAGMWLAVLVNLTGFPLSLNLLPYVAKEIYLTDQTGLGYLVASFAGGALLGSTTMSFIGAWVRPGRMMIVFSAAWHVMLLMFAHTQAASVGVIVLAIAGFTQSLAMVPLSVMLLRTSDPRFRGRVMGVRAMAVYSLPLGLLAAGALIERIGFAATASLYASFGIAVTVLIALCWRRDVWRDDGAGNAR
jgi:MFS family permease